jgi:UDPglucose 6-dehydrogenase
VLSVAESIGRNLSEYRVVVTKSTVPVGTADKVRGEDREHAQGARCARRIRYRVESGILKEGAAIADFMKPDRIVVGTDNPRTADCSRRSTIRSPAAASA